jgi:NADH:ubiquinone oxidoreductase subunit 4 (subunit M)
MRSVPDLTRAEMAAAGLLSFGILVIGFHPAPAIGLIAGSVGRLARFFGAS